MRLNDLSKQEVWLIVGSQHLYGDEVLNTVAANTQVMAQHLSASDQIPVRILAKDVVTSSESALHLIRDANMSARCIGIICWMHTFSPAKMWIPALTRLQRPLLHLHTQFHAQLPWHTIDMDYMNLHQSAHGGREFGFLNARLKNARKVVVGHWQTENVTTQVGRWVQVCSSWADTQEMKVARFGDNMRDVAVTEGDKVSAQIQFGFQVNGFGMGDLSQTVNQVPQRDIGVLVEEYLDLYDVDDSLLPKGVQHSSLLEAAKIELGIESFLTAGGFKAFTTTFENLHGLRQLPGIAVQRLMQKGYGFGAEGDWKTAALLRMIKVMGSTRPGGTSFMEDYTYHFGSSESLVLGAHMLEICPSITVDKPRCSIHPLQIGGKEDPVRLVFDANSGAAINTSLVDLGGRFRLLANEVSGVQALNPLPKLPVARALWRPEPNLEVAAAAWITAGGAHHTVYSQQIVREQLEDLAEIMDVELVVIDEKTNLYQLNHLLRWNEMYFSQRQTK